MNYSYCFIVLALSEIRDSLILKLHCDLSNLKQVPNMKVYYHCSIELLTYSSLSEFFCHLGVESMIFVCLRESVESKSSLAVVLITIAIILVISKYYYLH